MRPGSTARFLLLLSCLILYPAGADPDASFVLHADVDRDSITVGDPVTLRLVLESPGPAPSQVTPQITFPPAVRVLGSPEPGDRDDQGRWIQEIRLTSFRPGDAVLSDLRVQVVSAGGDTLSLSDDPISIVVRSVKPDTLRDILDVKAPVSIDAVIPFWVWAVLAAVVLVAAAWMVWRRRGPGTETFEPAPEPTDWFEEVRRLRDSDMLDRGAFDPYYTRLSEALRRFIEDETGVDAMERATFEIRGDLTRAGMGDGRSLEVEGFLTEADLVKFAKYSPDAGRAKADADRVLALMAAIRRDRRPEPEQEATP